MTLLRGAARFVAALFVFAAPFVVAAQERPIPAPVAPDAFDVAPTPLWGDQAVVGAAAVGLSLIGLALNAGPTTPASRVNGGFGLLSGALAVGTGLMIASGEESGLGLVIGGLGAITIFHASRTLRRAERERVSLAPQVTLGAQPTVGVRLALSF